MEWVDSPVFYRKLDPNFTSKIEILIFLKNEIHMILLKEKCLQYSSNSDSWNTYIQYLPYNEVI